MDTIEPYQIALLMAAVAYAAFLFGRASANREGRESREERQMRTAHEAEQLFSSLSPSKQEEVDRLLTDGQLIPAIKAIREETGAGLRDAKLAADYRRRMVHGPS
ncbi:MAG: hypothetical protein ACX939_00270 [Hyphococcus sp.]